MRIETPIRMRPVRTNVRTTVDRIKSASGYPKNKRQRRETTMGISARDRNDAQGPRSAKVEKKVISVGAGFPR
jgi:hypothetical protein